MFMPFANTLENSIRYLVGKELLALPGEDTISHQSAYSISGNWYLYKDIVFSVSRSNNTPRYLTIVVYITNVENVTICSNKHNLLEVCRMEELEMEDSSLSDLIKMLFCRWKWKIGKGKLRHHIKYVIKGIVESKKMAGDLIEFEQISRVDKDKLMEKRREEIIIKVFSEKHCNEE